MATLVISSSGNHDLVVPDWYPASKIKGALLLATFATGTSAANDANASWGTYDGTNMGVVATYSDDGVSDGNPKVRGATDVGVMLLTTGGSVAVEATPTAFIDGGIRVNATGGTFKLTAILFGGDELTDMWTGAVDGPNTGSTDITAPGFEPTFGLTNSNGRALDDTVGSGAKMVPGFFTNIDGVVTQNCYSWGETDNGSGAAKEVWARIAQARISKNIFEGSVFAGHTLGSFDSSGFTISNADSAGTTTLLMLVGRAVEHTVKTGIGTLPGSSGGEHTVGSATDQRAFAGLIVPTRMSSLDANLQTSAAGTWGFGAFSKYRGQASIGVQVQDAVTTSNTQTLHSPDRATYIAPHSGGAADLTSGLQRFPKDGTARLFFDAAPGGGTQYHLWMTFHRRRGVRQVPRVHVKVPQIIPPSGWVSFFDHFDHDVLDDSHWASVTASSGTVSVVNTGGVTQAVIGAPASGDAAFLHTARKLDMTKSQRWMLWLQFLGGTATNLDLLSIVQSASAPATVASQAALDADRRIGVGVDISGSPDILHITYNRDGDGVRRYWRGADVSSPNTWSLTAGAALSDVSVGSSASYHPVCFDFDADLERFRVFVGHKAGGAIADSDQGIRWTAQTDWVLWSDFTVDVDSLWLVLGDRRTDAGTCEVACEAVIMETEF